MSTRNNPPPSGEMEEVVVTAKRPGSSSSFSSGRPRQFNSNLSQFPGRTQTTPGEEGSDSSAEEPLTPAQIAIRSGLDVKTEGKVPADLSNLRIEIIRTFSIIVDVWRRLAPEVQPVITSGRDGSHGQNSLHDEGLAIDLRANNIDDDDTVLDDTDLPERIRDALQEELGSDYDVVFEYPGEPRAHIHIEYDPDD